MRVNLGMNNHSHLLSCLLWLWNRYCWIKGKDLKPW